MEGFKIIKKDFIDANVKCGGGCPNTLTSETAYYLMHTITEEIIFCGKTCAEKKSINPEYISSVPDFTRACNLNNKGECSSGFSIKNSSGTSEKIGRTDRNREKWAVEYVGLRMDRMTAISSGYKYEKLNGVCYKVRKGRALENEEVELVTRMAASKKLPYKFKFEVMYYAYTHHTILSKCLRESMSEKDRGVVNNFLSTIKKVGYLSDAQVDYANSILKRARPSNILKKCPVKRSTQ